MIIIEYGIISSKLNKPKNLIKIPTIVISIPKIMNLTDEFFLKHAKSKQIEPLIKKNIITIISNMHIRDPPSHFSSQLFQM